MFSLVCSPTNGWTNNRDAGDLRRHPAHHDVIVMISEGFFDEENSHDDVIKWRHFPRSWPFVRGIHRLSVNSPHRGQWRGAFMFSSICAWINGWVNNREADDLRRHRVHRDVTVMARLKFKTSFGRTSYLAAAPCLTWTSQRLSVLLRTQSLIVCMHVLSNTSV